MPVPHIIVLICFNQSEPPRGAGEYIYSVGFQCKKNANIF